MKNWIKICIGGGVLVFVCGIYFLSRPHTLANSVLLAVPYASQAPYGSWTAPWNESCEETSALMVEAYYQNVTTLSAPDVSKQIKTLVAWEDKIFGDNKNSSATQTQKFIEENLAFHATVKLNPTVQDIKTQLNGGHPVIAFLSTQELYQASFKGITFHVVVLIGYNEAKKEFIIHDPARIEEKNYSYARVMNALHDLNLKKQTADGPPVVLFTASKKFTKNARLWLSRAL